MGGRRAVKVGGREKSGGENNQNHKPVQNCQVINLIKENGVCFANLKKKQKKERKKRKIELR